MVKNSKKMRKKRYKLKSSFKRFLVFFVFFLGMFIYTIKESIIIYKDFQYRKTDEFKIIAKGYSLDDARHLLDNLGEQYIEFIIKNEYDENYIKILNNKYFLEKNFLKYIEYEKYHEDDEIDNIIAIVNVHANFGWYNASIESDVGNEFMVLVNKFYHLNGDFSRDDIVNIPLSYAYDDNKVSKVVLDAYLEMRKDIKEEMNVNLMVNSSYRSYQEQEEIYEEFKKVSQKYADSYAARPGYSEHQTGLAIDITSLEHKLVKDFKESAEYEWLKNNCYKYGFILRYPEDKEFLTGYSTESWHFRYVGLDVAKIIHDENITFDEYHAYYVVGNNEEDIFTNEQIN